MSVLEKMIKPTWRLLPLTLRERLRDSKAVVALRRFLARWQWHNKNHDEIYDADYFRYVDETTLRSADALAESIVRAFNPTSVIDVGCGTGALLAELRCRGVRVRGLERAKAALSFCESRGLDVRAFNVLEDEPTPGDLAEVVVSMEVGAQLPENGADRSRPTVQLRPEQGRR